MTKALIRLSGLAGCSVHLLFACDMRLWYLLSAHEIMVLITQATSEGSGEPARPRSLDRAFAVRTPEPPLFAHMEYGSRQRVRPKIRHLTPLDGCACAFEE